MAVGTFNEVKLAQYDADLEVPRGPPGPYARRRAGQVARRADRPWAPEPRASAPARSQLGTPDFDHSGTADIVDSLGNLILVNPPGYHSW